jgi:hypothetical protein
MSVRTHRSRPPRHRDGAARPTGDDAGYALVTVTILLTLMLLLTAVAVTSVWTDLRRAPRADRVLQSRTLADTVLNALYGQALAQNLLPQQGTPGTLSLTIPGATTLGASPAPTALAGWATWDSSAGRFSTCPDLQTTCFRYAVSVQQIAGRNRPVVAAEVITRSGCTSSVAATCVFRRFQQRWKQRELIDYVLYTNAATDTGFVGYDVPSFQLSRPDQAVVFEGYTASSALVANGGFEPGSGVATVAAGATTTVSAPATIGAWRVEAGSVNLQSNTYGSNLGSQAGGTQHVDLNGSAAGTLAQDLSLSTGSSYLLTFRYAYDPSCATSSAAVRVTLGSLDTTLTTTNSGRTSWSTALYPVDAQAATQTLRFTSQTAGACGVLVDDVRVLNVSASASDGRRYFSDAADALASMSSSSPAWRAATQFRLTTPQSLDISVGTDEASVARWRITRATGLSTRWTWATSNTFTIPGVTTGDIVAVEVTSLNDVPGTNSLTLQARRNGSSGTWYELRGSLAGALGVEFKSVELSRAGDVVYGRVRTNGDNLLVCGGPRLAGSIEASNANATDPATVFAPLDAARCAVQPVGTNAPTDTSTPTATRSQPLPLPLSTATLASTNPAVAVTYPADTTVVLQGTSMQVTQSPSTTPVTTDVPSGKAVLVQGNLTISGATDAAVTFYATGTVRVAGDLTPSTAGRTAVDLGIVAGGDITIDYDPSYRQVNANLMSRGGAIQVAGYDTTPVPLAGPPVLAVTGTMVSVNRPRFGTQYGGMLMSGMVKQFQYPSALPSPPAYLEDVVGRWERLDLTEVPADKAGLLGAMAV